MTSQLVQVDDGEELFHSEKDCYDISPMDGVHLLLETIFSKYWGLTKCKFIFSQAKHMSSAKLNSDHVQRHFDEAIALPLSQPALAYKLLKEPCKKSLPHFLQGYLN